MTCYQIHMLGEFQIPEAQKLSNGTKMGKTRFIRFRAHISTKVTQVINTEQVATAHHDSCTREQLQALLIHP